jgi:predicted Zn-dependent peptidase
LELISDIAFHSNFPENEFGKEREIILDEINSYKDSPSELIFDEFEELLYNGNALARNILGSEKALKSFTPRDIRSFVRRNYSTHDMVVSSVGNIPFSKLVKLFEAWFSVPEMIKVETRSVATYFYKPFMREEFRKTHQAHCIIGNLAYKINDSKRLTMYLLNHYLGGPGMNSRLNMALRERKGYAYSIDSLYTAYSDTGNLTIYYGTDKLLIEKCRDLTLKELHRLRHKKLGHAVLQKVRKQVLGHMAISSENNENYMLSMGKSLLVFNRVESLDEIARKAEAITPDQILEVANEVLEQDKLSYLIYR